MKKILLTTFILVALLQGCTSLNKDTTGKNEFRNAHWITDAREWPVADSLMYGDWPAPLFRYEFTSGKEIKSATLCD